MTLTLCPCMEAYLHNATPDQVCRLTTVNHNGPGEREILALMLHGSGRMAVIVTYCPHCGKKIDDEKWKVKHPCKPDIFQQTYEAVL